jgi:hypothetical protein
VRPRLRVAQRIDPDRPLADLAARRAHGLAHAVTRVACDRRTRDEVELIAKSVAYAIAILSGHDMAL